MERLEAIVSGKVHGVWFRHTTKEKADELGLRGEVRNVSDGTVHVVAEGIREHLERLVEFLHVGPRHAKVDHVDSTWKEAQGSHTTFDIS